MGADAAPTPRQWQGHSHCALRARLTHIRKASSYMGACVAPMPPRKRRAFNPKGCPCARRNACVYFAGLLAPRPRQHGMLHPKLRLTAQEKSNRKRKRNNAFSSVTPVFLFVIASALREAHDGSGPATAGVWGRHQPPHSKIFTPSSKKNRLCFIKNLRRFYAREGILWD